MTKASTADQHLLLALQEHDRLLARLNAERRNLPIRATLAELTDQERTLDSARIAAETALADARRELAFAEGEVQLVRTRKDRQQKVLDAGTLAPKDLANLQVELANLAARQGELEENELLAMEGVEACQARLSEVAGRIESIDEEISAARSRAEDDDAKVVSRITKASADRETIAQKIPEPVLDLYEQVRARTGGLAVVELRGQVTSPVSLDFSLAELDAIRSTPDQEVYVSDEHDYIIVRTS